MVVECWVFPIWCYGAILCRDWLQEVHAMTAVLECECRGGGGFGRRGRPCLLGEVEIGRRRPVHSCGVHNSCVYSL